MSRILLGAALLVFVMGGILAIARPGSLDDGGTETATPAATTTSSTSTASTTSTSATTPTSVDGAGEAPADDTTATTQAGSPTTQAGSPTTQAGSGLGSSGVASPSDTSDGLAATGGESWLLAGLALGVTGLAARRREDAVG